MLCDVSYDISIFWKPEAQEACGKSFNLEVAFADFISDETRTELALPPMTTDQRKEAKRPGFFELCRPGFQGAGSNEGMMGSRKAMQTTEQP